MEDGMAQSQSLPFVLAILGVVISTVSADTTTITIIHYDTGTSGNSNTSTSIASASADAADAALTRTLGRALEAYPGALLLNPTGHLGKRLWVQHDATAPNLEDIVERRPERALSSRETDPLLAANVRIPGRAHVRPSTVVSLKGGARVGLVGFVSEAQAEQPEAAAQMVRVTRPEEAVRSEARRLKDNTVPLVIALGNAGFPEDEAVAALVDEVDAVVAAGDGYPVAVRQQSGGRAVPLLRAPPGTVCVAQLMFGDNGTLIDWGGFTVPIADGGLDA